MAKVRITGWRRDASKVAADKLLAEKGGLGLFEAHSAITTVLAGGSVEVPVPSRKAAIDIAMALRAMNFDADPC